MLIIALLIVMALVFILLERFWPAAQLPTVKGWGARVALLNVAQVGIVILAGRSWDKWFQSSSLFHLSNHLNDMWAALICYLVSCVIFYGWHRVRHESELFWRLCHQLHHSPRRIELLNSFYKHPVEITINSLLSSAIIYLVLGCSLRAAAIYTVMIAVAEYFYHWNIRTPRWFGWWLQRPESHRVHHQRDRHSMNYADLPVIDWLFGTLQNPKTSVVECGFDPARERRFGEMLVFRDVHKSGPSPSPTCFGCSKRWICQSTKGTGA